jgi:hypothetical protein
MSSQEEDRPEQRNETLEGKKRESLQLHMLL